MSNYDLPIAKDPSGRFLPWLMIVLMTLINFSFIITFFLNSVLFQWENSSTKVISIFIEPPVASFENAPTVLHNRIHNVLKLLTDSHLISTAYELDEQQMQNLLKNSPVYNFTDLPEDILITRIIHAEPINTHPETLEKIHRLVKHSAPWADVQSPQIWLQSFIKLAMFLRFLSIAALIVTSTVICITIIYAIKMSLSTHMADIEILHFIGATDHYIAKQFSKWIFGKMLISIIITNLLTFSLLHFTEKYLSALNTSLFVYEPLKIIHWIIICMIPLTIGIITLFIAYRTVTYSLKYIITPKA